MTVQSLTYLKSKFETGDVPSQQDFIDLLDSFIHYNESLNAYSILKRDDSSGNAQALNVPVSTIVGRKSTGGIAALSVSEVQAMVGAGIPSGLVSPYAGDSAPAGWLLCDGSLVSRTTYADLYAVTGDTYGDGDGTTTFNLPDLRARAAVGADDTNVPGTTFGSATYDASHDHSVDKGSITFQPGTEASAVTAATPGITNTDTATITVDTVPPSLSLNFIIKI
jgi:microcystin-dependent protein